MTFILFRRISIFYGYFEWIEIAANSCHISVHSPQVITNTFTNSKKASSTLSMKTHSKKGTNASHRTHIERTFLGTS